MPSLMGQQQYAALYVNEITLKLLPVEDSVPIIYEQYSQTMRQLQGVLSRDDLKMVLRAYEQVLFNELGFAIDLDQDCDQYPIEAEPLYRFAPDRGGSSSLSLMKT
nr:DNA repair protein RecO C-terminal domain-containing protein [Psychrobacter sp. PraFG1]UNK05718.1 DNA repair protein RecO C-terminal domain-containing protein [Psychrobacter sp. PraFG1]